MSTGPTLTINRTTREVTLTRSPLGLQGVPGAAASISDTPTNGVVDVGISSNWAYDHVAAADPHPGYVLEADVDDVPVDGATAAPISSNWAFDHLAASDPHPGHVRGSKAAVSIQSGNYTLQANDDVVVFTATATATLPAATGSGRGYRIVCRAGTLTIDPTGAETVKGATTAVLSAGEDLIITDTATGVWE